MLRRTALGVLAALAAAALAAAVQPAAAAPPGGGGAPVVTTEGTSPAFTPFSSEPNKTPKVAKHEFNDMCPPPANYAPSDTAM